MARKFSPKQIARRALGLAAALIPVACAAPPSEEADPLVIGDAVRIESRVLGETRRVNVYAPPAYAADETMRVPVLYMPDGGLGEDFLHIAGLVQIGAANGTMRPMLLVGIENTQRRRDLTGPTQVAEDRTIAPEVGGSAKFRAFLRTELMPLIERRYRTTGETAIAGESLAGLFVVETLFTEPDLFGAYVAIDPALWWNGGAWTRPPADALRAAAEHGCTLHLASGRDDELAGPTRALAATLERDAPAGLSWSHASLPDETHATVFHPAALAAFRALFAPAPASTPGPGNPRP